MADPSDLTQFSLIPERLRQSTGPDPAVYDRVVKGLEIAGRVLGRHGSSMTAAECYTWLGGVRALHLAGLLAVGPPGHRRH